MLRIRIGQHWKHEGAGEALDGFGLELDGMALVPGASEEPLGLVMEQLLQATAALAAGQALAQVSLPESSQELLLVRQGEQLHLHVLRLGRPAGAVRAPVTLDVEAWRRAVVRAASGWVEDLRTLSAPARVRSKARALLARADREPPAATASLAGWGLRVEPRTAPGFRLKAADAAGLLDMAQRRTPVPVSVLALPGQLQLVAPAASWEAHGMVGLLCLELLRQAEEVVRALETGERALRLSPGGVGPAWQLELQSGRVLAPGWALDWPAASLAEALAAPALGLASLLGALAAHTADNRYLSDFTARGRAVLAAVRAHVARPEEEPRRAPRRHPRKPKAPELQRGARVRRLSFIQRGQVKGVAAEGTTELRALAPGFLVLSRTGAVLVTDAGEEVQHWTARDGLVVGPGGEAVLSTGTRWLRVYMAQPDARWLRDHEGGVLDGGLLVTDAQLLLTLQPSGIRAIDRLTGRELWRFLPARPQRLHLAFHGGRVLVASESGAVHGLDVQQGSVRFRIAGPLPCLGPPMPWGASSVVLLGRGDRLALLVFDPHAGAVRWLQEFPLAAAGPPLARGARLRVLGRRDGAPVLVSLGAGGRTQWERPLPLGSGPWTLHADGDATLVAAADGSAVRVDAQGRLDWRLGGQRTHATAPAALQRKVLFVAGETIRAVDARSGRVVAEIASPGGVHALAATETLDVAVLDSAGDLTLWKLGASLGVVE